MKFILVATVLLLPSIVRSQDAEIIDQYGQNTGYRVRGGATSASPAEMVHMSSYLNQNAQATSIAGGLSTAFQSGLSGYQTGQSIALTKQNIALKKQELALKELELEQAKQEAQSSETVVVRRDVRDAWVNAMIDLSDRIDVFLKQVCAENPKDERCAGNYSKDTVALVYDALLYGELALVRKASLTDKIPK